MTDTPQSPQVNLNITDIADAVNIIDYACENGAFRGWNNIRQIIVVRDRLEMFVATANAAQEVNKQTSVLPEAEDTDSVPRPRRGKRN